MPLIFDPDPRNYSNYDHFVWHFRWAGSERASELLFHLRWVGKLTKHHELALKSLLLTQSPPFRVWVWLSKSDVRQNEKFVQRFRDEPAIEFKVYVPDDEAVGTPFEHAPHLLHHRHVPFASDAFRLAILYRYGGIYCDFDVVFLRDFRPLNLTQFFYQWSDQNFGNNAVLGFFRGSPTLAYLMELSIKQNHCNGRTILRFDSGNHFPGDVFVFPSFSFDPVWLCHDRGGRINDYCNDFDDFFLARRMASLDELFPASFAYHWHNRWKLPIHPARLAGHVYDALSMSLENKRRNIMGAQHHAPRTAQPRLSAPAKNQWWAVVVLLVRELTRHLSKKLRKADPLASAKIPTE